MNRNLISPKCPLKVKLLILWHWLLVVATIFPALLCLSGQFMGGSEVLFFGPILGVVLCGWLIWATRTGIAFSRNQNAALRSMQRVHLSAKYATGVGALVSLLLNLLAVILIGGWGIVLAMYLVPFALFCLVLSLILKRVTRTLQDLDIDS